MGINMKVNNPGQSRSTDVSLLGTPLLTPSKQRVKMLKGTQLNLSVDNIQKRLNDIADMEKRAWQEHAQARRIYWEQERQIKGDAKKEDGEIMVEEIAYEHQVRKIAER